jgi:hypothetical protein
MPLTVKHILTECGDTALIRNNYFDTKSMKDLLTNVFWDFCTKLVFIKSFESKGADF